MEEVRYHPLITDGESRDLVPMFSTTDAVVMAHHRFHLEEAIPKYYRLCSKDAIPESKISEYLVHCPYCGNIMKPFASSVDAHKHYLCRCTKC